jgi:hypothetical protein
VERGICLVLSEGDKGHRGKGGGELMKSGSVAKRG